MRGAEYKLLCACIRFCVLQFLQFCVALSFFECVESVDCQLVWTTPVLTVMPFCIFIAFLLVLRLGFHCVYTPPETYRNVRLIRPCFFFTFASLLCSKVSIAKVVHIYIYGWSRGCASARLLAIGFARKDASSAPEPTADISIGPEPIADISIIDISQPRPGEAETLD